MNALRLPEELLSLPSVHYERLSGMIGTPPPARSSFLSEMRFVFLCYTNRCGSEYAGHLLSSTGFFNLPGEFFNFDVVEKMSEGLNLESFFDYFVLVSGQRALNGIFVAKVAASHIRILQESGVLDRIIGRTSFISMERSDRLGQAISLVIADRTKQWMSYMHLSSDAGPIVYDREQLEMLMRNTIKSQSALMTFFAINGLDYFSLNYEQLVAGPIRQIQAVCSWLRVEAPNSRPNSIAIRKQATELNAAWKHRYLSETLVGSGLSLPPEVDGASRRGLDSGTQAELASQR